MRKLFFVTAVIALALVCFSSCNLDFGDWDGGEETVVIYGVATHVGEIDHTCLYVPSFGHVTMPGLKSGEKSPEYKLGDLVKITFVVPLGDIPIMESFPAQFGAKAEEIVVKSADIGYYLTEEGTFFSDILPEDLELAVGDELGFDVSVEEGLKEIAEGVVTDTSNGKYTVLLESYGTGDEFLEFIFEKELSLFKK